MNLEIKSYVIYHCEHCGECFPARPKDRGPIKGACDCHNDCLKIVTEFKRKKEKNSEQVPPVLKFSRQNDALPDDIPPYLKKLSAEPELT